MSLGKIRRIVLVLSGKGGVGKSSVTTQLALSLSLLGHSVGVLDTDLTGPNMPRMFNIEDAKVTQAPGGWLPVLVHHSRSASASGLARRSGEVAIQEEDEEAEEEEEEGEGEAEHDADPEAGVGELRCMSLGFLLQSRGDSVVWRGPKKTAMIRQFLSDVLWGELDYLLVDSPPGTSDEHISLAETLLKNATSGQVAGAVVVTTPQAVATSDVRKELNFCAKTSIPVIGIIENMSGFICPNCAECTDLFGRGGGRVMASDFEVPFLGEIPIDPQFGDLVETGRHPVYPEGTIVNGQDFSRGPENGDADVIEQEGSDRGLLVDKYRTCALQPLFQKIAEDIITAIG